MPVPSLPELDLPNPRTEPHRWAEAVRRAPSRHYPTPHALLESPYLSPADKLRALRTWEIDERLAITAESENMGGGPPPRLRQVRECILALESEVPQSE